jgi:hypothetical protein
MLARRSGLKRKRGGSMTNQVFDDPARRRFELDVGGASAFIDYHPDGHMP